MSEGQAAKPGGGTVLLTGATGTLGTALLGRPAARERRVRAAARRVPRHAGGSPGQGAVGPGQRATAVEWTRLDLLTDEGLGEAVAGVDVIVHAASAPRGDTAGTDVEGTRRLVEAAARAGVGHLLYVSIVGVDRLSVPYYRHKWAAEALVEGSGVPWTILRGTQFHDLVDRMLGGTARWPVAVAPRGWLCQPIHVADFADAVWEAVERGPSGRAPDVGGPEVLTWPALVGAWWRAQGRPRRVVPLPVPGRLSAAFRRGEATAPGGARGSVPWGTWIEGRYGREERTGPSPARPSRGAAP